MKTSLITLIIASLAFATAGPVLADLTPHQEAINTAIENGLAWLRTTQNADGSWTREGGSGGIGGSGRVGTTGLATLAFLDQGITEEDTDVSEAVDYILTKVRGDGSIYDDRPTYETAIAIMALQATSNPAYEDVIQDAADWLVANQNDEDLGYAPTNSNYGGWGYPRPNWSDLSNTQFAVVALKAAGLSEASDTWTKAITYIQRCQNADGGLTYQPGGGSYGSMTAAGTWCYRLCGLATADARVQAGLN